MGAIGVPALASDERLRIGLTSVILADQVAFLSRWAVYLSARVGCEVVFVARESYQAVLDLLFAGRIDVAWICGYPYVRHQADLSLLAVPLYQDRPLYQSYLIRSKISPASIQGCRLARQGARVCRPLFKFRLAGGSGANGASGGESARAQARILCPRSPKYGRSGRGGPGQCGCHRRLCLGNHAPGSGKPRTTTSTTALCATEFRWPSSK